MDEATLALLLGDSPPYNTYHLVYQGDNHSVYCNGERHITTEGGLCWPNKDKAQAITFGACRRLKITDTLPGCNCAEWAKYRNGERAWPPLFDNVRLLIKGRDY